MKNQLIALAAALLLAGGYAAAQGTMSDEQVLQYVERGIAQGKSQQKLQQELLARGVNRAQAERVKKLYESRQKTDPAGTAAATDDRRHTVNGEVDQRDARTPTRPGQARQRQARPTDRQRPGQERQDLRQQGQVPPPPEGTDGYEEVYYDEYGNYYDSAETFPAEDEVKVFGRDIFRNKELTFAPSENIATPRNYRLGPGDEVIIDIFGANQATVRSTISPEGSIIVEDLGPLYLSGMTVDGADAYLKKRLAAIYGGLNRDDGERTDIRLSVGQIRTIQVSVLGDVLNPGTYTLSAFATAFHALYVAGGIVDPGTLRGIEVKRGGKVVGTVDVYDFLIRGGSASDVRLEDGDVVLVGPYSALVQVDGKVRRPMYFEMKDGETVADLIAYAGGFATGAATGSVTLIRQDGKSFEVRTVEEADFGSVPVKDGDQLEVGTLEARYENRVSVYGAVYQQGVYELGPVQTVTGLIAKAGGLLPEAFLGRAVIHREHPDKTMEVYSIHLGDVMSGRAPDFVLQNNDGLYIANGYDIKDQGTMTISGLVANPGTYPFAENTTVEDFIIMAGGLLDGASTSRVDVSRRKKDADGLFATQDVGRLYTFSLKPGLEDDGLKGFVLEPYDEVTVHTSPSYGEQKYFSVDGEVNFAGTYAITSREERLSDLVAKAGGVTGYAYLKGARLIREMNGSEVEQARDLVRTVGMQVDTSALDPRDLITKHYNVAIELDKALAYPGSEYDVVLRENDRLEVPVMSNVVRVRGAVMMPTVLTYNSRLRAGDYIDLCGGYGDRAMRTKAYIVSMNGSSRRLRRNSVVEPGSEIFVPERPKRDVNVQGSVVAYSSAAASLATMLVAIISLVK